jgi:hypothetical protein
VTQQKQIGRAEPEQNDRVSVCAVEKLLEFGPRLELTDSERIDVTEPTPIKIAGARMVQRM